jgi:peptidoglycan hydrolase-like protein with peptidoglycan-binding domain
MNLPSLALPQSKLFQSRIGILILLLVVAVLGAGVFLFTRPIAPTKAPSVATSPAAVATPRPVAKAPVYGPPAPSWVKHEAVPAGGGAPAAAVPAPVATAVSPVGTQAGVVAGTQAAPIGVPGVSGSAVEAPQSLDASVQYVYTSSTRRDPFLSLLDGKFQSMSGEGSLVDVGDMHLVGIMWGSADKFALVEDSRGRGYVLRVGDPVVNGYISGITKTDIQVVQNAFGESQSLSIQLKPKEGETNATRN